MAGRNNGWPGPERRHTNEDDEWRRHVDSRLDAQDELLKDIRSILVFGKWGVVALRWIAVTGAAVLAALLSYKGLK